MERMTIAQTCEVLGISRWTLGRLIDAGQLTATKQDQAVRNSPVYVDAHSVRGYISRHTVPAPTTTEDPQMSTTRRLLTLEEVAEETGIPLKNLRLGCRSRRYRHVRIGKYPRMTAEQVIELIKQFTVEPEAGDDAEADADRARVMRLAQSASGPTSRP